MKIKSIVPFLLGAVVMLASCKEDNLSTRPSPYYKVSVSIAPGTGTGTVSVDSAKAGTVVTMTVDSAANHTFRRWVVATGSVGGYPRIIVDSVAWRSSPREYKISFTMPARAVVVRADFLATSSNDSKAQFFANPRTYGKVSSTYAPSVAADSIVIFSTVVGQTVNMTATPVASDADTGAVFKTWLLLNPPAQGGFTNNDNLSNRPNATRGSFTMTANLDTVKVEAQFVKGYKITLDNTPTGGTIKADTVNGTGTSVVPNKYGEPGATITIMTTPAAGNVFEGITVTSQSGNVTNSYPSSTTGTSATFTMPSEPVTVVAAFGGSHKVKMVNPYAKDSERGYKALVNVGSVTVDSTLTAGVGAKVRISANPNRKWAFDHWEVTTTGSFALTSAQAITTPFTFDMPDEDLEIQAIYSENMLLELDETFAIAMESILPNNGANGLTATGASRITSLNLINKGIKSLIGLDIFTNLMNLDVSSTSGSDTPNLLDSLDLTGIEDLVVLRASGNRITKVIDLEENTGIIELNLSNNKLATVDLSALTGLQRLNLSTNLLTALDISHNTYLFDLIIDANSTLTKVQVWSAFDTTTPSNSINGELKYDSFRITEWEAVP